MGYTWGGNWKHYEPWHFDLREEHKFCLIFILAKFFIFSFKIDVNNYLRSYLCSLLMIQISLWNVEKKQAD